jgi:outer membrane protein assembly factor BamD (BamD/ComL family)
MLWGRSHPENHPLYCGIIGRMENPNNDNLTLNSPEPNQSQGVNPGSVLGESASEQSGHPQESDSAPDSSLDETIPTRASPPPAEPSSEGEPVPNPFQRPSADNPVVEAAPILAEASIPADQPAKKSISWPMVTFLGLLVLVVIAVLSAFGGYRSGINLRTSAQSTQVVGQLDQQFVQAQQDMADKQFDRARQRLEYIIQNNPNYPGAAQVLAAVLVNMSTTATPTAAATPTLTPTPDTRNVDTLYTQAQQAMQNKDWSTAIDTLLALRKADPNNHTVDVDGMLFLAFRNRGKEKIIKTDLEGGLYDLSLAERFGPLDSEALGLQNWVRLYITGASFWDIDWKQVVYYFAQVGPAMPSLMDGSGMTASERYRVALFNYGNDLAADHQWCDAQQQYELSLSIGPDPTGKLQPALNEATQNCSGNSNQPPPPGGNPSEVAPTPPTSGEPTATLAPPPPAASPTSPPPPADTPPPPPADTPPPDATQAP